MGTIPGSKLSEEHKKAIAEGLRKFRESDKFSAYKERHSTLLKGRKHSAEWTRKVSEAQRGKFVSKETREKQRLAHLGEKHSPEHNRKMSIALSGEKNPRWKGGLPKCLDCGKKLSSYISRYCHKCSNKGDRSYLWKGGIGSENQKVRSSFEYKLWREAVFKRDNFTCVWCGLRGGRLNADHIKPFADYPELRFAIDNGRTLCVECHKRTDTYGIRFKLNRK